MDSNSKHSTDDRKNQEAGEGNYKNTETSVNNPFYFNDNYESKAEDEIAEEEAKTEKERRSGKKSRRGNRWKGNAAS